MGISYPASHSFLTDGTGELLLSLWACDYAVGKHGKLMLVKGHGLDQIHSIRCVDSSPQAVVCKDRTHEESIKGGFS